MDDWLPFTGWAATKLGGFPGDLYTNKGAGSPVFFIAAVDYPLDIAMQF